jgi:hypothetical protein
MISCALNDQLSTQTNEIKITEQITRRKWNWNGHTLLCAWVQVQANVFPHYFFCQKSTRIMTTSYHENNGPHPVSPK